MTHNLKDYGDIALMELLKNGDSHAFEEIYDRYSRRLFQYVFNRLNVYLSGRQAKEISEEIIQEIFVSLWARHKTIVIKTGLQYYLFGAAKFKVFDFIRADQVRREYAEDLTRFLASSQDNSSEELSNLADIQHIINRCISKLPPKCQMAFRLSRMEHLSTQEVALHMNISRRTVENYLTQALRYLRESLL